MDRTKKNCGKNGLDLSVDGIFGILQSSTRKSRGRDIWSEWIRVSVGKKIKPVLFDDTKHVCVWTIRQRVFRSIDLNFNVSA